jgi:hypothetical protein
MRRQLCYTLSMKLDKRINAKNVVKVAKYRKQGLSFREIARLLNSNVKSVYRWNLYANR